MQNHEQLIPKETERVATQSRGDSRPAVSTSDAERMYEARTFMLDSIESRLSPLMHKAIEIKLAHEKEDLDELIKTEAAAEVERVKRRGVLDARFFRKRSLPNGIH